MEERIDLVVLQQKRRAGGIGLAIVLSAVLHGSLLLFFLLTYKPAPMRNDVPIARYVELIKQNPKEFVEAPGPKVDRAPLNAPLSNANREASTPRPTGETPTQRPGDGRNLYTPPMNPAPRLPQQRPVAPQQAMQQGTPQTSTPAPQTPAQQADPDRLLYRESAQQPKTAAASINGVDWRSAIKEVSKIASLGGGQGMDLNQFGGGEEGFAKEGPLSFETQWYDWGDYAQSMVSRIRVNWYGNMPQLIRTGMAGVVTIRFTIQRDGGITDINVLKSSGVPPYDFAARKAIELSSPLQPLPKDFPNPSERVTCMFYYNMDVPPR